MRQLVSEIQDINGTVPKLKNHEVCRVTYKA